MSKLVSQQLAALRQEFRQFEHGGHCFGSDDISAIVRRLGKIGIDAAALEDRVAADRREPLSRPLAVPVNRTPAPVLVGTFFFQPAGEARP